MTTQGGEWEGIEKKIVENQGWMRTLKKVSGRAKTDMGGLTHKKMHTKSET